MRKTRILAMLMFSVLSLLSTGCGKKPGVEPKPEPKPEVFDCSKWSAITGEGNLTVEVKVVMLELYGREKVASFPLLDEGATNRTRLTAAHICALNEALQKKLFKGENDVLSFEKDKILYQFILVKDASLTFRVKGEGGIGTIVEIRLIPGW